MNVLFLISHQPNPRFVKQLNYFASNGDDVSLAYFHRPDLATINDSISKQVDTLEIGRIQSSGKYSSRVLSYLSGFGNLMKYLKSKSFDIAIVNNLDTLFLFLICKLIFFKRTKMVVEISDLREFVFTADLKSKVLRVFEKFLYRSYVNRLIITSPKYYEFHFSKFFHKPYFVLENKPLSSTVPNRELSSSKNNNKVVIGIVGLLLRGEEYKALFEVFKDSDEVEIKIFGKGAYQVLVEEYSEKYENINYYGSYNFFEEAHKIYTSIDLIYIVYDTENGSKNNQLALPNKLYEAMNFGVPIICSKNTYLEERVIPSKLGYSVDFRNGSELLQVVDKYKKDKSDFKKRFKKMDSNEYLADNDYDKLSNFLKQNLS